MRKTNTLIMGAILFGTIAASQARTFEDKFGRVMEANLVSHTGAKSDKVKINKGGKEMVVKVGAFSAGDQKYIRDWMAKTPASIDYAFRVEADKKVVDSARSKAYYEKGKSADTLFELRITNLTRQTVKGIKIEYKAFLKNFGDPSSFGGFNITTPSIQSVTDSIKVDKEMAYNRSAVIKTKTLRVDSARGSFSSSNFNDDLLGVIVRVYDPTGKQVTEWRTPNRAFEKIPWEYGDKKGGTTAKPTAVEIE